MFDSILRGARVIDPINRVDGVYDVAIQAGKIALVAPNIKEQGIKEYDFTGKILQSGIIDTHVHISSTYGSHYGQRTLAMEGVTTCLDMAGPAKCILDETPQYGAGLNIGILEAALPPESAQSTEPSFEEIN